MEMWCLDDMARDSWDWVGPPARGREHDSTPQKWAPRLLKRSLSRLLLLLWWWCGRVLHVHVYPYTCARATNLKMGQCQCTDPFDWTDQPDKRPYALSLRRQVPGVPKCKKLTPLQFEEKDCGDTPVSPPTPPEKGVCNLFHLLGVGCPWSGIP